MSTKDKLVERFKKQPKDFTWDELVRLFGTFGFTVNEKGKTSVSRTVFINNEKETIEVHKPHSSKIIKGYVMKNVLNFLIVKNFVKNED